MLLGDLDGNLDRGMYDGGMNLRALALYGIPNGAA